MTKLCNEDCFNCVFPDCRLPEYLCRTSPHKLTEEQRKQREKEQAKAYREAHKEHIKEYQAAYRARKREERNGSEKAKADAS